MLQDTFCSSPWFHLRITYSGEFQVCRWYKSIAAPVNFANTSIMEFYNGQQMRELRKGLLDGETAKGCSECYYQDQFGKLSGRQRQLLKSAVQKDQFDLRLRSSPHYDYFKYSNDNEGLANYHPIDLQIDLSNICNSACIMCTPMASSLLTQDYIKLTKIDSEVFPAPKILKHWSRDPVLLDKFINEIIAIPNLSYIHFLGGETLYDESFYIICERLIAAGKSNNIILGTTTNGTVYNQRIENIIQQFKQVHLGVSIESVTELNNYIRYPSSVDQIKANIDKFLDLRSTTGLHVSLRIAPNIFTIYELDQMFEYLIENRVIAESCNILTDPAVLRMELLPDDIRAECLDKFNALIDKYDLEFVHSPNVRNTAIMDQVIANTIIEYRNFLRDFVAPTDVEQLRTQMVAFLKGFESLRKNTILDYAPRYQDFLRHYGY